MVRVTRNVILPCYVCSERAALLQATTLLTISNALQALTTYLYIIQPCEWQWISTCYTIP
jgi:hypothetical protein